MHIDYTNPSKKKTIFRINQRRTLVLIKLQYQCLVITVLSSI